MIRYHRNDTDKARKAVAALKKAKASNSGCNTPEVNAALAEMFHGKCYICENKEGISSFQIEHLNPHRGDTELMYDWNNLFWSCAHCNNIKNAKYEPILDCSQVDVDRKIAFRKEGYFGRNEKYRFIALEESDEIKNTVALLQEAYYGSTPQKILEATNIQYRILRIWFGNMRKQKTMIKKISGVQFAGKWDKARLLRRSRGGFCGIIRKNIRNYFNFADYDG